MTFSVPPDSIKLAHMLAHTRDQTVIELVTRLLNDEWHQLTPEQQAESEAWYNGRNNVEQS
jgi:hypothetical protein